MANVRLHEFIQTNRTELISRCKAKVAKRSPPSTGEVANAMDSLFEASSGYEGAQKFSDLSVAKG